MLRFSKCGSVSSDHMLICLSKHTLFLHSGCQSYFLVSSHNAPVKLCQVCFLGWSCSLPDDLILSRFVCSNNIVWDGNECWSNNHRQNKYTLSYQRCSCHRCPPVASNKVSLGLRFMFSGQHQKRTGFTSFEVIRIGVALALMAFRPWIGAPQRSRYAPTPFTPHPSNPLAYEFDSM